MGAYSRGFGGGLSHAHQCWRWSGRYREFVLSGIAKDMNITFWEGVRGQAVLGSDEFVEWVFDRFLAKSKVVTKEFPRFRELERGPETVEEIGRGVAGVLQVPEAELRRRRSRYGGARSVFTELCRLCPARKKGLAEIGRERGAVSVSALSQNRARRTTRRKRDPRVNVYPPRRCGPRGVGDALSKIRSGGADGAGSPCVRNGEMGAGQGKLLISCRKTSRVGPILDR